MYPNRKTMSIDAKNPDVTCLGFFLKVSAKGGRYWFLRRRRMRFWRRTSDLLLVPIHLKLARAPKATEANFMMNCASRRSPKGTRRDLISVDAVGLEPTTSAL